MAPNAFEPSRSKSSLLVSLVAAALICLSFVIGVQFGKQSSSPVPDNHITNHDDPLGNQLNDAFRDIYGTSNSSVPSPNQTSPVISSAESLFMVIIGPPSGLRDSEAKLLIKKINKDLNLTAYTIKYKGNSFWIRLVPSFSEADGRSQIQELQKKGFTASLQPEKK